MFVAIPPVNVELDGVTDIVQLGWYCTVTVAVQLEVLPAASVNVKVTVLLPAFEQLNVLGLTLMLDMPQLSQLPLLMLEVEIVPVPPERFSV